MAGKTRLLNILLEHVPCGAANILKQEMLTLGGDAAVARGTVTCSLAATGVLLMGTLKQFQALSQRLPSQPFGLAGLARQLRKVLDQIQSPPQQLHGRGVMLSLKQPCVMGILNVTPDSFYDGGRHAGLASALRCAETHIKQGADLIDVGGESTRPGAPAVSEADEVARVVPVVEALCREFSIPVSVDTTKACVAEAALAAGAHFINDVSGLFFDEQMATVVAKADAGLFVMHTRGRPEVMQHNTVYEDLLGEVIGSLAQSLALARAAGVRAEALCADPGIGFGKSVAGNLELLRRLPELSVLGVPILLGTSRKSFIGQVLNQPHADERLFGSLSTVALGVASGVQIFRVHDVAATRQVVDMAWAIETQG
ncbi:MAG: dihydropteroate synthase [Desulfuromonadaceae bacterium]|nr:dihydropteroate synthase [Desulfuromonadaceae bacterium]